MFRVFLFVFVLFFLNSCRRQKENKNEFVATIYLKCHNNNSFQLFYKLITDDRYTEEFSIRKNLNGSANIQKLVFVLPKGIKPKNIRFDLGENENDSITITNISFQYKNKIINGALDKYKSWFDFNSNVVANKTGTTYYLIRKDNIFDPQLNGNRILNAKLVKLFLPDIYEK